MKQIDRVRAPSHDYRADPYGLLNPLPAAQGRRRAKTSRTWVYWLAGTAVATVVYFLLSIDPQAILWDIIGVSAAGAMFVGLRASRAEPRPAWVLLGLGVLTIAVGDIVYGTSAPIPSLADMFYVSGRAVLAAGLIALIRRSVPGRDRSVLVDASAIGAAVVVASAVFVATIHLPDAGFAAAWVSISYPLMDLVMLGLVARLALTTKGPRTYYWLLATALLLLFVGDSGYAFQGFGTLYAVGGFLDASWILGYAFFGAALLHPSLRQDRIVETVGAGARRDSSYRRPASIRALQGLRLQRVIGGAGLMALGLAVVALPVGLSWRAPDVVFLGGVYGTTGSLMLIASFIGSA